METKQIPKPKRILGPVELTLNGKLVTIEDKLKQISLESDEQLLMVHFNARAVGKIPSHAVGQYLSRFFDWKVQKVEFTYITLKPWTIMFDGEEYEASAEMPYRLKDAMQDQVNELHPFFGKYYEFLTHDYLNVLGVLKGNDTLLDRVSNITLVKGENMISFGCGGDCQPSLTYAQPWTMLQEFIDFFSKVPNANVRVGICTKTLKPKTEWVQIVEGKSEQVKTGKMRTVSSCSS